MKRKVSVVSLMVSLFALTTSDRASAQGFRQVDLNVDLRAAVVTGDQLGLPVWTPGAGIRMGDNTWFGFHVNGVLPLFPLPVGEDDHVWTDEDGSYRYIDAENLSRVWVRAELGRRELIGPLSLMVFAGTMGRPWFGVNGGVRLGRKWEIQLERGWDQAKYEERRIRLGQPPEVMRRYTSWEDVYQVGVSYRFDLGR